MRNAEKFAKVYPSLHLANPIPRRRRVRRREGIDLSFPLFRGGRERKEGGWRTVGGGTKVSGRRSPRRHLYSTQKSFLFLRLSLPLGRDLSFFAEKSRNFYRLPRRLPLFLYLLYFLGCGLPPPSPEADREPKLAELDGLKISRPSRSPSLLLSSKIKRVACGSSSFGGTWAIFYVYCSQRKIVHKDC